MPTPHNNAAPGAFAKTVLMPAIPCAPSSLPRRFWKTPCW